jgi:hypothetical protein
MPPPEDAPRYAFDPERHGALRDAIRAALLSSGQ